MLNQFLCQLKTSSENITDGIKISVSPEFVNQEELSQGAKFVFSYRVDISNVGGDWAKLLSRYWKIIDSDGNKEEVKGAGVIGYFPELKPGQSFTYTSYCPLQTDWGTMEGHFDMVRKDGTTFQAKIDRFYLVQPELLK